jgi:hypothetical protein
MKRRRRGAHVGYLLNHAHPDNGGKAQFFVSLGFSSDDPEALIQALLDVAQQSEVVRRTESAHGEKYMLTVGCRCTLKRAAIGRSGRFGSLTVAGVRRGS